MSPILDSHSCLDSSIGRAMYQYYRDHGFESHLSLFFFFFRLSFHICLSSIHNFDGLSFIHSFICSSNVQPSYVSLTSLHHYEYITYSQSEQLPAGLINVAQLVNGRALYWYCRDHGLESWLSLNCFHGFFSQLLKMRSRLNGLSFIHSFICDSH